VCAKEGDTLASSSNHAGGCIAAVDVLCLVAVAVAVAVFVGVVV